MANGIANEIGICNSLIGCYTMCCVEILQMANKLVKTYSLGRGGQDRDHLTISYQVNNQNYTFEVFAGSIVLDSADEEIKNIFNNSNYEERNTEYKNQAGAFYYYSIEEYNESIFDEYFK